MTDHDHLTRWIAATSSAKTHREIYSIALEINEADDVSREVREAARKVLKGLRDVINLPIANASVLAKADRKFAVLVEVLRRTADPQRYAA